MSIKIGQIEYFKPINKQSAKIFDGLFRQSFDIKVRIVNGISEEEISKLLNLEAHPNVQRIFGYEYKDSIFYIGLRSFDVTLKEFIKIPVDKRQQIDAISIVKDITTGLKFLHDNKIFHSNISSGNVGINYNENIALLCNCGFDNLQEETFIAPEELSYSETSYPVDVFNLGVITYYILSNGGHPFGVQNNPNVTIESIRTIKFKCSSDDLVILKYEGLDQNIECARSLLKDMLNQDPKDRITCNEILKRPLFWNNFEVYKFFREINQSWNFLSDEDKNIFNDKWIKYCNENNIKKALGSYGKKSLVELVEFIVKKVRHFEDSLFINEFKEEHILHYVKQLPFLLPFVYEVTQGMNEDDGKSIQIPEKMQIRSKDIQCNNQMSKNIFKGKFKAINVLIKKTIKKNLKQFDAELKNIKKLIARQETQKDCKSCKNIECENILKFFGCYEELNYYCIVLDKVEMNLENFLMVESNAGKIKSILFGVVKGLECLHANSIAHININTQTVMIVMRNGIQIGCLGNFGEVDEVITDCGSEDDDKRTIYTPPELFKKREKNTKIDYSKCDIFSLGILFKTEYLSFLLDLEETKCHSKEDLRELRKSGKITFLFEELVNFMTEETPLKRPNAEGVRKNPFFWNAEMTFQFLRNVAEFMNDTKIDKKVTQEIGERALKKLFVVDIHPNINIVSGSGNRKKKTEGWIDFLVEDKEVYGEVIKSIGQENRKCYNTKDGLERVESIFCLVNLILLIFDSDNPDEFKAAKAQLNMSNLEKYLNYWLTKFELIGFLYYVMEEYMNKLYPSFYSTQTPKRILGNRRMSSVLVERSNVKRSLFEIEEGLEDCHV